MRKIVTIGAGAVFALGLAAGAMAASYDPGYGGSTTSTAIASSAANETYSFKATLNVAQETPKPKASAGAGGTFTARTVETKTAKWFTWKLTFQGLSGAAGAAHVHLGKKGVAGGVIISLCGPCKSGQTGKVKITGKSEDAMEAGKTYVNVHTAKNAGGEIRGQLKLTGK